MSETNEPTASVSQLPPGMTITKTPHSTAQANGAVLTELWSVVTFGSPPRSISVVDLDMGAQFDLAEVTGGSDNMEFRNMAFVAASIRKIDDVPISSGSVTQKPMLRDVLRRLGPDGYKAAIVAIRSFADNAEPDFKAAAGN